MKELKEKIRELEAQLENTQRELADSVRAEIELKITCGKLSKKLRTLPVPRQNIIVFDGPDMCGKTEMALELSSRTDIPYFKNEYEWDYFERDPSYFRNAATYGDPYFASYLDQTGASVIMDRWYPSEWVYSKVFNRRTNKKILESVDALMSSREAKIIIPYRTTYDGLKDQFESVTPEKMKEIEDTYRLFAEWTKCDVFWLNVDDEDLDREINEILNFLGEE